jgi:hypothetical protein
MFGPRFDPDVFSVPASCFFGLMQVEAEFDPEFMRVTCTAPAAKRPHLAELRVSLDSQVYSVNAELVNYGGNPDQTTVVAAPMSALAEDVPLDYLAFTPDHCVFFEVGDFASLESLHTSEGMMEPGFQSDLYE